MKLQRGLILSLCLTGLCSQALAGGLPASANVSPVVLITEAVDINGAVTFTGSSSGIAMGASGFGQSSVKSNLPQSGTSSLSNLLMPAFNPVSSYGPTPLPCQAGAITAGCVLSGAANWITANATVLQTTIGQYESTYGYSIAWLSYSQSIQLTGESAPRSLSWSMFVNAQGAGTWGAPQLSSGNGGVVLYVSYASLSAPIGVLPSWVTALNANAGSVQWQLLDATLTPIQCVDMSAPGCTLPVSGAFDAPIPNGSGTQTDINAGYTALLGPSTGAAGAATVQALLAKTGASFALVDYAYALQPEYDTVSDAYCPNGATSCSRAVGQYTYTALRVDMCTCGTANYVNTGSYSLTLQDQVARNVVTATALKDGSSSLSSNLLKQLVYTVQSPTIAFNASGNSNAGSWVTPITHAQALAVLSAATPQVLLPTDGTKLVDAAALLTPGNTSPAPFSSVLNGVSQVSASAPPLSLPTVTSTGSDILYWAANPIPGVANTYLAVEARCDANSNTQFISGFNLGAVEATDSNPNGGFINPAWAFPQQASPANTFVTGNPSCAGAGAETDIPNSTYATIQYFYASSPSCTILAGVEGAGDVCPAAYRLTSITDPNGDNTGEAACLFCASGTPGAVNNDGNISYSCSTGSTPSQLSSVYEIPLNAGGLTCSQSGGSSPANNPQVGSSYGWVAGPWPSSPPSCAWESRSVVCVDQNGAAAANAFCTGPQPAEAQFMTGGCTYSWFAAAWSAPSATCSVSATETRAVSCIRSDGSTVPDSACVGQVEPATSQTLTVSSGCPYQWGPGAWGSCTGGTFGWQYSSWAPASACGNASQSRTATSCSVTTDSGSASRSVTCVQQSDGTTVANGNCSALPALGAQPPATEVCTPQVSSNAQCGATASLAQNVLLTNGCAGISFSWVQNGYGACTGGSGTWQYGSWTPVSGCGVTTQTRSGSCTANANSATATQTLSCLGSDGKSYPNGVCTVLAAAPPATSESCTPSSGYSCGTEAALAQNVTLTDQCSWNAGNWGSCAMTRCPVGSHPQSGCGDPYLPFHFGNPPWNSSWVSDDAQGIPASELNFCANGSYLTPGLPWDKRSIMGATGDWCYDNSSGGFVAPAAMGGAATQSRSVSCQAPNGTVVANNLCAGAGTAPIANQPCTSCMTYENHVYSAAEWTVGEQNLWDSAAVCTDGSTIIGPQQDAVVNGGWLGGASGGGGIPGSLWNVTPWVPATSCPAGYTQERTVYCAGSFSIDSNSILINTYPDSLCMTDPTFIVLSYDVNGDAIMGYGPPVPKPAQCR